MRASSVHAPGLRGRAVGLALAFAIAAAAALAAQQPSIVRLRAVPADAVSLLLAGREGGDLEAEVTARMDNASSAGAVAVAVALPWSTLAAPDGGASELELFVYALGDGNQVRAHLAERHLLPAAPAAGEPRPTDGATILEASLSGLSGSSRLRVLVRDRTSLHFALREIRLERPREAAIADGAASAEEPDSAGAGRSGSRRRAADAREGARRPPQPSPEDDARRRAGVKVLARGYEAVLLAYAAGAGQGALADLRRLELRATANAAGKNDAERLATLAEAQATVAERLAEREPDTLVPVLHLHLDAHALHMAELDLRLAAHARDRVVALAELYASAGRSETAIRLASDALTAVGSYLQGANQLTTGRKVLERAVELDPRNLEARFAIALGRETRGEYAEALATLDALAGLGAYEDEVRLRRATLLARLRRENEAVALYESLIAGASEHWIAALAYQELARLQLGRDRPVAARAALEQAVRRFPGDPTLRLQLAYALERGGERSRAREIVAAADRAASGSPAQPSPRTLYQSGLDRVGRRSKLLDASAVALLPVLASTLESMLPESRAGAA